MSYQADAWVRHTQYYLIGTGDEALAEVFMRALMAAGYPTVSPAMALEAICADFLAGASEDESA